MWPLLIACLIILVVIIVLYVVYLKIRNKIRELLMAFFGTPNLKEAIEKSNEEASTTPRTVYGMDSIMLPLLNRDFPELNLNELKAMSEKSIYNTFRAIEKKTIEEERYSSEKVIAYIQNIINDLKDDNVSYSQISIHKTVLNKYEKSNGVATIRMQTAFEYIFKKNEDIGKKIQDRLETEFIYIIDETKINDSIKSLGINCPNCGAPIKTKSIGKCEYCGSGIIEEVKHAWILNNIKNI